MWTVIDQHKKRWYIGFSLKLALEMARAVRNDRHIRCVVISR